MLTVDEIKDVEQIAVPHYVNSENTSGFPGVCYKKQTGAWVSYAQTKGSHRHYCYAATARDAFFCIPEEIRTERWPEFCEKLGAEERRAA